MFTAIMRPLIFATGHAPTFCLALALMVAGCSQNPNGKALAPSTNGTAAVAVAPLATVTATNSTRTVFDQDLPTQPNPRLQALRLFVGAHEVKAELALTEMQIRTGMMFRTNVVEDETMLFVFPNAHQVGFWMKNVSVELSCAYIDPEGIILETHDMVPHEATPIQSASDRVQFVLETRRGWFERHGIQPGVLIRTERGTLQETFFQRRPR